MNQDSMPPDSSPSPISGLLCPVCRITLLLADRQGIEIDYCPQCRGVWLDRGELDKIIERNAAYEDSASGPPPAAPFAPAFGQPDYRDHSGGHRRENRHGGQGGRHGGQRGGFLSGLFGH